MEATQAIRRRTAARGVTLIEGLISSVLLAVSVVGVSGTLIAAHQSQHASVVRSTATLEGKRVMEAISALPLDPAATGQAALSDYQLQRSTSTTTVTQTGSLLGGILSSVGINLLGGGIEQTLSTSTGTTTATPAASTTATSVTVDRRGTLNGAESATGDFALVTVTVPTDGGKGPPRQFRRLITRAEAESNRMP